MGHDAKHTQETHLSTFPAMPPLDAAMPATQETFTWVWALIALASILYCSWQSLRQRSGLPLAILVGSSLSMFAEALVIRDMHCWYPAVGQITAFTSNGQSIPLFVPFAYVFFFAPGILMLMQAFERGMSQYRFWATYGAAILGVLVYEYVGLSNGLWLYYGDHPLMLAGLPLTWAVLNPLLLLVPAVVLFKLHAHLKGPALLLVVVFMAAQVTGLERLIGYPIYAAINSNVSSGVALAAALLSIAMALIVVWLCARLLPSAPYKKAF